MRFFQRLASMHPIPRYVLTRCVLLTCALLASALVLLVWAGGYTYETVLLYDYSRAFANDGSDRAGYRPDRGSAFRGRADPIV